LTLNGLHGVISQKMVHFITIAVRTSNPTKGNLVNFVVICRDYSANPFHCPSCYAIPATFRKSHYMQPSHFLGDPKLSPSVWQQNNPFRRVLSSGIQRPVDLWKVTDISEKHIASIFSVEE
jgi:hypothetical protein